MVSGKKSRIGYEFGLDVPILNLDTFQEILKEELRARISAQVESAALFAPSDADALLAQFPGFQEVYRRMLGLLRDPSANSSAIVQLLSDPAFDDIFVVTVAGENDHLFPAPPPKAND